MDNVQPAPGKASFYIQRTIGFILLLALSATFFYSAYTKSGILFRGFHVIANDNAFDSFQWTFIDLGISRILLAGIIARLMIGFELMLGLFLLFHVFLKRFTYNAVIVVLSIFIIYLLLVILKQGNTGNCGCFGDQLQMTPLQAIWKNVAMIIATVILKNIYPADPYKKEKNIFFVFIKVSLLFILFILFAPLAVTNEVRYIIGGAAILFCIVLYFTGPYKNKGNIYILFIANCSLLLLTAFSAPFLVNPVFTGTNPEVWNKPVNLDPLYNYSPVPDTDLRKGKHIIAFMSLTCPHCKKAAYLLHIIHNQHPDIPIYIVLDGPETYQKQFFDETHAADVPNLYFHHSKEYVAMAGTSVPSIYWVNNGIIEYKSVYAYYQLDPKFMEQWLHK